MFQATLQEAQGGCPRPRTLAAQRLGASAFSPGAAAASPPGVSVGSSLFGVWPLGRLPFAWPSVPIPAAAAAAAAPKPTPAGRTGAAPTGLPIPRHADREGAPPHV